VIQSSRDPAFDDSVVRAIRGASPFPPPPEKYRQQFAAGVEAVFKLSDLKAGAPSD
jgi:TonB family protein